MRILFVLDHMGVVTPTVRALQYASLFEADPDCDASFVVRQPPWLKRLQQAWPQRPQLRWPVDWLAKLVVSLRERRIVRESQSADLVCLVTVPSFPLHQRLRQQKARLVMDVVDALWLPWFRQFGWDHLEEMFATADGVICENEHTADYVRHYSDRVFLVPDSPQLEVFDRWRDRVSKREDKIVLGWIGGKDSVDALYVVFEALERLFSRHDNLHLRLVGAPRDRLPRFAAVDYSVVETYDQETMVKESLGMHIGLFPQFNVEEFANRGTLKAKIYMSGEAAVIGQDLGVNGQLIEDGKNGHLAKGALEWEQKLEYLVTHPEDRGRIARAGLATIRERYTARHSYKQLVKAFKQVAEQVP